MKKTLLSLLLVSLSLTMFFGCAEEKKPTPPTPNTPINFADVNTLQGNYAVEGFATIAKTASIVGIDMVFTNNCATMKALVGNNAELNACVDADNVKLASQARITIRDGKPVLETKVQMWGGNFATLIAATPALATTVIGNSYNYTRYQASNFIFTSNTFTVTGANVTGRNFTAQSAITNPIISGSLMADGRLRVDLDANIFVPTNTYVVLRKVSDAVSAINPNALITTEGYTEGFVATEVIAPLP